MRRRFISPPPPLKQSKVLARLSIEQRVSLVVQVLALSQAIIFAFVLGVGVGSFVSVLLGITVALTVDRISRYIFENDVTRRLNRMNDSFDSLECIGGIKQGLDWLCDNIHGLQSASNTVFGRADENFPTADPARLDRFTRRIRDCLQDGCKWTDVFIQREASTVSDFYKTLNDKQKTNYRALYLETNMPMMQYTILRYKNGSSSVIFGWGFPGGDDHKACVFVSDGERTVDFFSSHFKSTIALCSDPYFKAVALPLNQTPVIQSPPAP